MALPGYTYNNSIQGGFVESSWYDSVNHLVYLLRETHDYSGYELVKVNPTTGALITSSSTWTYSGVTIPELDNGTDDGIGPLFSSWDSDYLYALLFSDTISSEHYLDEIVQFDKTTLEIVQHLVVPNPVTGAVSTIDYAAMNRDGTMIVSVGGAKVTGSTFNYSYISLFNPITEGAGTINLVSALSLSERMDVAVFDNDGYLWIVGKNLGGANVATNSMAGASKLYKFSIAGTTTLSLVLEATYTLDDYYYPADSTFKAQYVHRNMTYSPARNEIIIWSNSAISPSGDQKAWAIRIDASDGTEIATVDLDSGDFQPEFYMNFFAATGWTDRTKFAQWSDTTPERVGILDVVDETITWYPDTNWDALTSSGLQLDQAVGDGDFQYFILTYNLTSGSPQALFMYGDAPGDYDDDTGGVLDFLLLWPQSITFSYFYNDTDFKDWEDTDPPAYLHTTYQLVSDTMFWMQAPYILTYLQNGSNVNDANGLLLQAAWDWAEPE
jgi:hypothetical protein